MYSVIVALALVVTMDEGTVKRAIEDQKAETCYPIKTPTWEVRGGGPVKFGCLTTPYSRVAALAQAARRAYKPFSPGDVPPEILEPYFEVIAFAVVDTKVEAVVVAKKGAKGLDGVVQPAASEPMPTSFQNLYGAKFEGVGMVARFPLSEYREGSEIRVVRGKDEFKSPMKPEKLK